MALVTTTTVSRSAQVALKDITLDDIIKAATKVGAPNTARVTTGSGAYVPPSVEGGPEALPYSATFSWTEEI